MHTQKLSDFFLRQSLFIFLSILVFSSCHSSKKITDSSASKTSKEIRRNIAKQHYSPGHNSRLSKKQLKRKYAAILETKPRKIKNRKLYYFIDDWYGAKYKWGGNDQHGVDCSGFVHQLYLSVYGITIKRTVATLYKESKNFKRQRRLREGDLIYFNEADDPSHVAVYLKNGYFVHSSKGVGVHISNINEGYWQKIYLRGGKIKKDKD